MLYIVSTPIGNLSDISTRAIETLTTVDVIACEDTRKTQIITSKFNIDTQRISYHSKSGNSKTDKMINLLKDGKDIALVSDAGTPGINDPGFRLIRKAKENNIQITTIPGPSAFLSALIMSGFQLNEFVFMGFIPNKKGRMKFLEEIKASTKTTVFYESCHRISKCLNKISEIFGPNREIAIVREITKMFEECINIKVGEIQDFLSDYKARGEYVVVVEGKKRKIDRN